jgi:hypothetical protein
MPENTLITRKYAMSDGEIALLANRIALAMTRDLVEFEKYGINSVKILEFKELVDDFQALQSDNFYKLNVSLAVEQRFELRNSIINTMQSITVRAKSVFGSNSSKFRSMNPGNITAATNNDLLLSARQVYISALANQDELIIEGITEIYLTNFNIKIDEFENSIENVANMKIQRDEASEAKILKGNELYFYIVKYCDYGKTIWNNVSPAKYNDYIIYHSRKSGKKNKEQEEIIMIPTKES